MKKIAMILVLLFITFPIFGQQKDRLAILPFAGGQGDEGEALAEMFSYDSTLVSVFDPIPRTSITNVLRKETAFQLDSGMTDPDSIVAIGHQLGAKYIVSGNIVGLGAHKLLTISIIKIENLQMVAGDIVTYNKVDDLIGKLPGMARKIVAARRIDTSKLLRLAVIPFDLRNSSNKKDADVLAQVLAINIVNSGTFAVYPRTKTLEQVHAEFKTQFSGDTADNEIARIGAADNPEYVLSGVARRVGETNTFNASIVNLETNVQFGGDYVRYKDINDGLESMARLATALTSKKYMIGETGPAGGIVFHDKGSYSDGPRYLEAAPVRYEFSVNTRNFYQDLNWNDFLYGKSLDALFGVNWRTTREVITSLQDYNGIRVMNRLYTAVSESNDENISFLETLYRSEGNGRTNTDSIATLYAGKINNAAVRCIALEINGFKDWFLPSNNELEYMYTFFKNNGGQFSTAPYLSSSIRLYAAGSADKEKRRGNKENETIRVLDGHGFHFGKGAPYKFVYAADQNTNKVEFEENWYVRPVRAF